MSLRPRVVTVLSAHTWETNFTAVAIASSMVRHVDRLEHDRPFANADVVIVSADTPWITSTKIRHWQHAGLRVIGIHAPGDKPARRLLAACDEIRSTASDPQALVHLARILGSNARLTQADGSLWFVTGPAGSPGRTEVAIALARAMTLTGETSLIDGDRDNPSVSIRLGLPPDPNIGSITHIGEAPSIGALRVLPGAFGVTPPTQAKFEALCQAALDTIGDAVIDGSSWQSGYRIPVDAQAIFVCDASPSGAIRAALTLKTWDLEPPLLIVNRVTDFDMVPSIRAATGLEPALLIEESSAIRAASIRCAPSPPELVETMSCLLDDRRILSRRPGMFRDGTRAAS